MSPQDLDPTAGPPNVRPDAEAPIEDATTTPDAERVGETIGVAESSPPPNDDPITNSVLSEDWGRMPIEDEDSLHGSLVGEANEAL